MYEIKLSMHDGGWLLVIIKEMRVLATNKMRRKEITTEYVCKDLKSAFNIIENDFNTP